MLFSEVANYFQKIEQESSRTTMTLLLADLFKKVDEDEIASVANLALGQMQPPYLSRQFNFAEKNLIKVLSQVLEVPIEAVQQDLLRLGDLGLIAQQGHWTARTSLSIQEVYARLLALQDVSGAGSQEEKLHQLTELLLDVDPLSAKFIVRIVLSKLRLGFSDMTLIDALSWMVADNKSLKSVIENAFNLCVDIGLIAYRLKKYGVSALENMHIQIGIPIRPSAAERLPTAQDIIDKLGPCVAQPKLDGFRVQVHVQKAASGTRIHFFSRNLIDMSHMFPDLEQAFAQIPVDTMICEGEAIVYDVHTNTFLPFQETVKRKRKHDIQEVMEDFPLRFYLFDLLYLNGKDLLQSTHRERRQLALSVFKNGPNDSLQVIGEQPVVSGHQLQSYFDLNISAGLEGLVVKREDATYQPGKRNFNWIKLKRQSTGHLEDTIDAVILGYYAGEGKRASFGIGAFLVGVFNKELDRFETVAKIGTGLSDEQWKELKAKCDSIAVKQQPKNVLVAKELAPDVWVSPEIVCVVFADEITISPLHTAGKTDESAGYALRFPRFLHYSVDKGSEDATTVREIKRLFHDQVIRK